MKACLITLLVFCLPTLARAQTFRAGAAAIDVTPVSYPVQINGGMTANSAQQTTTPIHARAIAMEHGKQRVVLVVVDSCMMSREFLDEAKALAKERTGLPTDCMMISATHAHSVPASMGCLGTDADPTYTPYLRLKLAEAIETALANLEPARAGWAITQAADYTAVRRWIRRPDRVVEDPFGNPTVRANMHAGRVWDDVTGESGPEDPELSMLSLQALDGRPIAVLANFSMHYFSGEKPVSADYFGRYAEGLKQRLSSTATTSSTASSKSAFVGIMSHGCSGDIWRKDYTLKTPARFDTISIESYTNELLDLTETALKSVRYEVPNALAMAEQRLRLTYRVPDKQRLAWAEKIVAEMGDRLPKTTEEVYAREQIMLHQRQETHVVVQALRIGSIAIATTPTETYALTGMKLKLQSPLKQTMVIELANGGDGYIPPPEQHVLGGYNTWAARSAGLEVEAEPKIAEAGMSLLEEVCQQPRRSYLPPPGNEVGKILAQQPAAYYRLDEMEGPRARDASPSNIDAIYEPGVVFFLAGTDWPGFNNPQADEPLAINRAAHFAGGRLRARIPHLADRYSVSLWIWNGMPDESREIAGWIFGRGYNHDPKGRGDALGLVGKGEHAGRLIVQTGTGQPALGKTAIARWTWAHVRFERRGDRVRVYLDHLDQAASQSDQPEIDVSLPMTIPLQTDELFFGGRASRDSSWEGRLDEIVIRKL